MKTFVSISLFIVIGSFVFNLVSMDFKQSLFGDDNQPYIIGLGAGVCALILCIIYFQYERLKTNLANRAKQP
ncbi:MAG: hypothetical protein ACK5IC_05870 [Moheibacter sp.]